MFIVVGLQEAQESWKRLPVYAANIRRVRLYAAPHGVPAVFRTSQAAAVTVG
jgi:hypothetical protein